ncbi:MAG: hypothetical protein M9894_14925 [Planctomycetes bacterium]|nr:hypothetical protein [Planctomycetota bacterium]
MASGDLRRLAALLVLIAAGCPTQPPPPLPSPPALAPLDDPAVAQAADVLERLVEARCLDPAEPWALVHGVIARGAGLVVAGEPAVDRFVRENLDRTTLTFPAARGGVKVEPHPGYFAKNAVEVGVPLARPFPAPGGGEVTLEALVLAQARAYTPAPQPARFFDEAWRLELLAAAAERDPAQAERAAALRDASLETLAENQAYLEPWLAEPGRPYDKPSQPGPDGRPRPAAIHRYVCGGFHLFQAVQRLHGAELPPGLAHQYRLLRLRLELEPRYWEGKLAEARARVPADKVRRHEAVILAQALKVLGHGLETWLRAEAAGALALGPDEATEARRALGRLAAVVLELDALGILATLDELRGREPQLYLDLVGDGAHALHAIRLWQARGT